jgi:diadenosine tetraphosphate (Ap4A) HIT family hydrolase
VSEPERVARDLDTYLARARAGCFVCRLLRGEPGYEHAVVWRDDTGVAFLAKYPVAWGHLLVSPIEHREHVIGDFDADQYVALQRLVHRAGTVLRAAVDTERVYVLRLGSQQANTHVHWHLAPSRPASPTKPNRPSSPTSIAAGSTSPPTTSPPWPPTSGRRWRRRTHPGSSTARAEGGAVS